MGLSKIIKIAMIDKGLKVSDVSRRSKVDSKVLSVKLSRDNLSGRSLLEIAEAIDCDIALVDRTTGKIYK